MEIGASSKPEIILFYLYLLCSLTVPISRAPKMTVRRSLPDRTYRATGADHRKYIYKSGLIGGCNRCNLLRHSGNCLQSEFGGAIYDPAAERLLGIVAKHADRYANFVIIWDHFDPFIAGFPALCHPTIAGEHGSRALRSVPF